MSKKRIYLDHHATTPVDPRVLEAMMPTFTVCFGNAASRDHSFGKEADELVNVSRRTIARALQAAPEEIIFTSGATESNNLAIKGIAEMYREKGDHIITASTEHRSVLECVKSLEKKGFNVSILPVDRYGRVELKEIKKAITPKTILISIMAANNEIGTLQPIQAIGVLARHHGIFFHVDAAQALGKIPMDVNAMKIDLMSFSAHKIYGPKGVGGLFVRRENPRVRLTPLIDGGGHEKGIRSGTLNVPGIVGMAKAIEIIVSSMKEENERIESLRNRLLDKITSSLDHVTVNGHPKEKLPGNLHLSFDYIEGEALIEALSQEMAFSMGSACTSAKAEPSYVLDAIGLNQKLAHGSVRIGIGRFNTEREIDSTGEKIVQVVQKLRVDSPLLTMAKLNS